MLRCRFVFCAKKRGEQKENDEVLGITKVALVIGKLNFAKCWEKTRKILKLLGGPRFPQCLIVWGFSLGNEVGI